MMLQNAQRPMWRNMQFYVLAVLVLALGACTATPPVRTLPEHIKRIYIPEFKNLTRGYALQADLTLYVNDAFMSDGRLDVVQNERADVRLEGRIKDFRQYTEASSSDRFPLITSMQMHCVVELWDPYDADRVTPISRFLVPAAIQYVSDPRRAIMETDTEARERLLRQMADNIVQTVITGAPLPPNPTEQRAVQRYQERHNKEQFQPSLGEPRFPEPTPVPHPEEVEE